MLIYLVDFVYIEQNTHAPIYHTKRSQKYILIIIYIAMIYKYVGSKSYIIRVIDKKLHNTSQNY